MKKLLLVLMLSLASAAQAEIYHSTCYLVNDFDDWNVRVGPNEADFFDNDHNCTLTLMKSEKGRTHYTAQCDADKIIFVFNPTKMTAEMQFPNGFELDGKTKHTLRMTCEAKAYQD